MAQAFERFEDVRVDGGLADEDVGEGQIGQSIDFAQRVVLCIMIIVLR